MVHFVHEIDFTKFSSKTTIRVAIVRTAGAIIREPDGRTIIRAYGATVRAIGTTYGAWRLKVRGRSSSSEQRHQRRYRPCAQQVR